MPQFTANNYLGLVMHHVKDWRLIACRIELNIALCAMAYGMSLLFGVLSPYCLQFPQPQYRRASKGDGEYSGHPLGVALQPAFSIFVLWQGGDQIISKRGDEHRIQDA